MKTIAIIIILFSLLITAPTHAAPSCEATIRAAEATIRGLPTEHAVAFDAQCNVVARFGDGLLGDVAVTGSNLAGTTITHNHSDEETLSQSDLDRAYRLDLYEIREVNPSGRVCWIHTTPGNSFVDVSEIPDSEWMAVPGSLGQAPNWYVFARDHGLVYGCTRR